PTGHRERSASLRARGRQSRTPSRARRARGRRRLRGACPVACGQRASRRAARPGPQGRRCRRRRDERIGLASSAREEAAVPSWLTPRYGNRDQGSTSFLGMSMYHPCAQRRVVGRDKRSGTMTKTKRSLWLKVAAVVVVVLGAGSIVKLGAQQPGGGAVPIDGDDIGGVITGPSGPEAGVWVIAETTELPTKFARIVVTDDQGRYVVPDLPKAKYKVWVRGYGLVDSAKVDAEPGKQLNLSAVVAPTAAAAAQYYPAIYWYSMLKIPDADQFGGKSNIPANITQSDWLTVVKNRSCIGCHQLGQLSTRTIPASLGQFETGEKAWIRRVQSGQAAPFMLNPLTQVLGGVPFKYFGDWTDRIAKGELPHSKPPRPQGVERNIVVTTWEWGDPKKYLHDLIASDRRYPTVNAYGKLYGSPEY